MTRGKENINNSVMDLSRSPNITSSRRSKIGEEISKEIMSDPDECRKVLAGIDEIKRGEYIVWKKKGR